jgi:SAM-dependent methyltransferase
MPAVAEEAAVHLDQVVCGDIETMELSWDDASFDVVICGDVLEHLADPWRALRRLSALLAPDGVVIASIPNIQNYRVIRGLLRGRWDYRERGLLDFGHLRFFTWRSIVQLFDQAGLEIIEARAGWNRTLLRRLVCWLGGRNAERFLTRYYLVVGKAHRGEKPSGSLE